MVQYGTSKKLEKEIATVTEKMTKLRSIKKSQLKESAYVRKCSLTELTELLKLRLHMTPLKVLEKCTKNLIGHSRLAFNNHESNIDC